MRNDHRKDSDKDEDWGSRGVFALRVATVLTVLAVVALGATGLPHGDGVSPASGAATTQRGPSTR